ncbi:4Fe-4S single cluster domain-containing protein [uncultured Anaerofustis sp.]|uniref:4Fe-4S single cluster domain-containing protein n=1 Tax=uncultured Anaerofustis sp. TaxID=904996 RepID=UPI0025FB1873|nr:4Fe-4S single cluster domain-containing protein [uncultured Anaerofustis sp.]
MINIYKIIKQTEVEGPGKRFCIWVQGCKHRCEGCFAKDTWDTDVDKYMGANDLLNMILYEKDIEGITFLGGEPFLQARELSKIAKKVKEKDLSVLTFTGYIYEDLKTLNDKYVNELLKYTDLLVDGPYIESLKDFSRPWVGSKNQSYIFLSDRYSYNDIKKYKSKIEMRINKEGNVIINGMGNFNNLIDILKGDRHGK